MIEPVFAFGWSGQELLIIAGIVIVLFGGAKIPQLMRGIGEGIREFKSAVDTPEKTSTPPPPAESKPVPVKD